MSYSIYVLVLLVLLCANLRCLTSTQPRNFWFIFVERSLELEKGEFLLGSVINAVVSQVMILLRERGLQLIRDIPEEIKILAVSGDQVRIQQVLADFLLNMVRYAPYPDGWVEIQVRPNMRQRLDGIELVRLEFRSVNLMPSPTIYFFSRAQISLLLNL